ncbi:LOW QUALITY PROTEIN: phosphatidylinositol transfer protein alpha isoform-like [Liolophura sinensis]|uniref:LOW QUALITY PROTEIN: phosphatidylinositol transfer protein alpha isoform-like n=1 Tax=Liolophura sinensis TaxID=3198878 RepID=UPI003158E2A8
MLIFEYRVVLPMTVEEYQRAQLFSVAEVSKNETGGGDGIEVKTNDPFDLEKSDQYKPERPLKADKLYTKGQYTHKIYHLQHKVPTFMRLIAPKGSLTVHEEAWNAYPYCRTVITNDYMKENFYLIIETMHYPDRGESENVHSLSEAKLKDRQVVLIDITDTKCLRASDIKADEDPSKFKSQKTGRGPLGPGWIKTANPVMCCYKLVTIHFKWWGLQNKVESYVMKQEQRIFSNFHRQVFCWTDKWYDLTMDDIRALEDKTKQELDKQRQEGEVRGMAVEER